MIRAFIRRRALALTVSVGTAAALIQIVTGTVLDLVLIAVVVATAAVGRALEK